MGMFDTVHLAQPVACVECGAPITATQTKAFECMLDNYEVGDCVAHPEESRIVREHLYCEACSAYHKQVIYLVVWRGILIDITPDLVRAETQLRDVPPEQLVLWYHDQYAKRMGEQRHRHRVTHFLQDLSDWYTDGHEQMTPAELRKHRFLALNGDIFEQAANPLHAVRLYLAQLEADADDADRESP